MRRAEPVPAGSSVSAPLLAALLALAIAVGLVLRLLVLEQSSFGDELSTYKIVGDHSGLKGVWDVVHSDAEITPPLYFLAAKLTTQIHFSPEMLRLPSLVAGVLTVPLTYLVGARTVERRAAIAAAALVALSPFLIYYSTKARGYQLAIALLLGSTIALLRAAQGDGLRWWVLYAACSCAAMRLFVVTSGGGPPNCGPRQSAFVRRLPPRFHEVEERIFPGICPVATLVFREGGAAGRPG